jgi:hypothetical protein
MLVRSPWSPIFGKSFTVFGVSSTVRAAKQPKRPSAMLGVGLDNDDGHVRLTKGKNYSLVGGSDGTHSLMQETAVKINEHLDNRGKRLEDVSVRELRDICHEVRESIG